MRNSLVICAAIATFVSSAAAAVDCNPSYNVPPSTTCFTNCNIQTGQKWVPGWTMDHTSPLFLDSLALMCNKAGPNYMNFMTNAGMCMAKCTGDDPDLFTAEFTAACAWWNKHKNDSFTVSICPTATDSFCQPGFRGKKNGRGPEGACCSHSDDCQESCIKGKCNAPIATTCYTGSEGRGNGDGYNGACCETSDDCWESCVKGKCNGPSLATCDIGFIGKKTGKGPKNSCCNSNRDCKNSCVKGKCD
ncbi:hypothetical protein BDF20DRAFT_826256 [Mycotypha africana]|uniref:uncharacterized protein n=1 Tax=Mycotypha africana TaxID=64632 RepID=UPI002300F697|nr:uncharacterized protein BDF20DRAFT_826256 [Mycotypha africana]KAI8970310.1 hypothetical protein BDF20DRAFT_826256 [Mycotypha africana]